MSPEDPAFGPFSSIHPVPINVPDPGREPRRFPYRVGGFESIGMTERNQALREGFKRVIREAGGDEYSRTPDYLLASYLLQCLLNFEVTLSAKHMYFLDHEKIREDESDCE